MANALSYLVPPSLNARYFAWRVRRGPETELLKEHAPGIEALVPDWSAKTPFETLRGRIRLISGMDLEAGARAIAAPLTLAHGRLDRVVPRFLFERLKALRPDARHVLWQDVGHLASITHPDAVAELL